MYKKVEWLEKKLYLVTDISRTGSMSDLDKLLYKKIKQQKPF